jgi:hypothetical protein
LVDSVGLFAADPTQDAAVHVTVAAATLPTVMQKDLSLDAA